LQHRARELSGADEQRVSLARAAAKRPLFYVFDQARCHWTATRGETFRAAYGGFLG
jgi:ABC-type sugar transport system ATPase subunit